MPEVFIVTPVKVALAVVTAKSKRDKTWLVTPSVRLDAEAAGELSSILGVAAGAVVAVRIKLSRPIPWLLPPVVLKSHLK
mgnify:FL=1